MLITFNQALSVCKKKFEDFEARELLFYAWVSPKADGLQAYCYSNDCEMEKYFFKQCSNDQGGSGDPLAATPYIMFDSTEVQDYSPSSGRWITWSVLLTRWKAFGQTESSVLSLIKARIQQGSLSCGVPVYGASGELEPNYGCEDVPKEWAVFPKIDLDQIEIEEEFQASNVLKKKLLKKISAAEVHDEKILGSLRALGYDPLNLPKGLNGHPGIPAEVRRNLGGLYASKKSQIFSKAWRRLNDQSNPQVKYSA